MPDSDAHTIDQLVRFRADHDGDKPMVIDPTSRLSYRELNLTTSELAAALVEAGVGKGTRVGLINGELGTYSVGTPGRDGYEPVMPRITAVTVRDGKIYAVWDVANPDKFSGSPLRQDPNPAPPTAPDTRHRN